MNLQGVIDELKNIKEQATNDDDITKGSVIDAITDIIHDTEGNSLDFSFDEEDDYGSYERETDFTKLEID